MATGKKAFTAYCDWISIFEELTDEEAGRLVKHIFRYVNDQDPKEPDRITKMCFIPIQQTLKRDLKKWEQKVERNRQNGSLGGRPNKNPTEPKKPSGFIKNPTEPKKPDRDRGTVNERDTDTVKENYNIPPSKAEVESHITQNFREICPKDMIDYQKLKLFLDDYIETNNLKGWKTNKNRRITVWRSNCNLWVKNKGGYEYFKQVVKNRSFQ